MAEIDKQESPNDQWCIGCGPENCAGGCDIGNEEIEQLRAEVARLGVIIDEQLTRIRSFVEVLGSDTSTESLVKLARLEDDNSRKSQALAEIQHIADDIEMFTDDSIAGGKAADISKICAEALGEKK